MRTTNSALGFSLPPGRDALLVHMRVSRASWLTGAGEAK